MQPVRILSSVLVAAATLSGAAFAQYQPSGNPNDRNTLYPPGQRGGIPGPSGGVLPPGQRGDVASSWDIQSRIQRAQERIDRNRGRNGLTNKEAKRLERELESIRQAEARMRSDGRLGRRDRDELDARLNRLNGNIRGQMN